MQPRDCLTRSTSGSSASGYRTVKHMRTHPNDVTGVVLEFFPRVGWAEFQNGGVSLEREHQLNI